MVIKDQLSEGQARTLVGIKNRQLHCHLQKSSKENLSVREMELLVKIINERENNRKSKKDIYIKI